MKNWKKIILVVFVLGLITAGVVLYMAFKKPLTAADTKPVKEMAATAWISEFENNAKLSDSVYNAQNIGVSGKIKQVNETDYALIIEAGSSSEIICTFDSLAFATSKANFKEGIETNVKGIYCGNEGFDNAASSGEDDLLAEMSSEKTIKLKTCAINNK